MTDRSEEFYSLLDELSYAITAARTAGHENAEELRKASKRIRDLAADLDALAVSVVAEERRREEGK